jgi:type IV pilus assembly protein PilW
MIALALGVVLTLGVVQVFIGSSQTYRLTDSLARVQENIRFTLGTLQHDARMAGHFGCLVGQPFNQLDDTVYEDAVYENRAVIGWEAANTGLGDAFTITTLSAGGGSWSNGPADIVPAAIQGDMIPGTDFVVISGAQRANVNLNGNPGGNANTLVTNTNTGIDSGAIITVVDSGCGFADLFQKTNNANSNSLTKGGGGTPGNILPVNQGFGGPPAGESYDDDADVYIFTSTAYFIGVSPASGEPALFRERLDAGDASGAVELAEGVESMQILYGVDGGVDRSADRYVTAANVTNWDEVVSMRMALLYRTDDIITDVAETRDFNLAGAEVTTQSDRRSRVVGLSTVGIRNRLE